MPGANVLLVLMRIEACVATEMVNANIAIQDAKIMDHAHNPTVVLLMHVDHSLHRV